MKKEACDHVFKKQVKAIFEVPLSQVNLSKKEIRSKEAKLLGVDWNDTGAIYCEKCGVRV